MDLLLIILQKRESQVLVINSKKQTFVDAFVALGNLHLSENIIANIREFTCHMYGYL